MNHPFDWKIESKTSLFDLKSKDVWAYRDLLWLLVRRDFVSFYKQTILGPVWFFLQPLFTTVIFTFVFGKLGGFKTDGIPQPLFYLAGITCWNYFADCITKTSTVFRDNANIFGKVYFPRIIMPLSIVISNLVRFGVQLILFFGLLGYYAIVGRVNILPSGFIILFPLLVFLMALMGLGMGMIISSMTTKYRDLAFLVSFGIQLLMYTTTVVYPLSSLSEAHRWIVELNPMTSIIEIFRYGFLGHATFSISGFLYTIVFSLAVFILGTVIFNRVEKTFVDTI
jgi:lipopolysaccharide transport system permease protein